MHPFIHKNKNIIFWWSPKCGCTTVKSILVQSMVIDYIKSKMPNIVVNEDHVLESIRKFINGMSDSYKSDIPLLIKQFFNEEKVNPIGVASFHYFKCGVNLKLSLDEASKYNNILFLRHPYKRFVSGFFDKHVLKNPICSFVPKNFIDAIENINLLDYHHFAPQFSNGWIKELNYDAVFNIEKIDYDYLSRALKFNVKPRFLHQNYLADWSYENKSKQKEKFFEKMINVPLNELLKVKGKVDWTCFFDEYCESKLREYYEKDFEFWEKQKRLF